METEVRCILAWSEEVEDGVLEHCVGHGDDYGELIDDPLYFYMTAEQALEDGLRLAKKIGVSLETDLIYA